MNIEVKKNAYFSPSLSLFYAANMVEDGSYGDSLPVDLIEITEVEADTYWRVSPPAGKAIGVSKGRPVWIDIPPLTAEQQAAIADIERTQLRSVADSEIAWRQDAIDVEIATEDEKTALAEWKTYRVLLMRVDTAAPVWPVAPAANTN